MGLERSRWQTAYLLSRGEFWYAQHEAKRIYGKVPEQFGWLLAHAMHEANYARAYDLLRHQWPEVKKP